MPPIPLNGQMLSSLLHCSFPFQDSMESFSECSLHWLQVDNNNSLDDLLNSTRIPIKSYNSGPSINLCWSARARKPFTGRIVEDTLG